MTDQQFTALTPGDVDRCVRRVMPGEPHYDALQIVMLGPDLAEVKVRSTADREWYQGVVKRSDWQAWGEFHGDPGHSCYDENGELACVIGKMLLSSGPSWQEIAAGEPGAT